MEVLFKKYFWLVKVLGFAGATGLAASAISTQLGTRYLLTEGDDAVTDGEEDPEAELEGLGFGDAPFGKGAKKRPSINKDKLVEEISTNNIFCPTCKAVEAAPVAALGDNMDGVPPGSRPTSLPFTLMATMESTDPKYSFATVFDQESEVAGLYGIGDPIRPSVEVTGIRRGVIHMRNGASPEYLLLREGPVKKKPKKTSKKEKKKKRKPSSAHVDGAEDAINCPSENLCVVDKAFVEKLLQNPASLAKQARIIPAMKDGETRGFKFYGIRRDSLPKLIGFKNGDMLTGVNGEELTSMDKAMGLYTKLRHASNLSVTIERKGKTINKEIQIK